MALFPNLVALAMIAPFGLAATAQPPQRDREAQLLRTPESVHEEHAEIHGALERASRESGELGRTARELERVLGPHFRREEEIATPPLAL